MLKIRSKIQNTTIQMSRSRALSPLSKPFAIVGKAKETILKKCIIVPEFSIQFCFILGGPAFQISLLISGKNKGGYL